MKLSIGVSVSSATVKGQQQLTQTARSDVSRDDARADLSLRQKETSHQQPRPIYFEQNAKQGQPFSLEYEEHPQKFQKTHAQQRAQEPPVLRRPDAHLNQQQYGDSQSQRPNKRKQQHGGNNDTHVNQFLAFQHADQDGPGLSPTCETKSKQKYEFVTAAKILRQAPLRSLKSEHTRLEKGNTYDWF